MLTLEDKVKGLFEKSGVGDYLSVEIEEDFYELMYKVLEVVDEHY